MLKIITKRAEMVFNSMKMKEFGFNPLSVVFIFGLFHIIVSIALLLYLLFSYLSMGYVSTMIIIVLMIWVVGAIIIMSLGLICKYILSLIKLN